MSDTKLVIEQRLKAVQAELADTRAAMLALQDSAEENAEKVREETIEQMNAETGEVVKRATEIRKALLSQDVTLIGVAAAAARDAQLGLLRTLFGEL